MLTADFDQLRPLLERALERYSGDAEREGNGDRGSWHS